MTALDTGRDLLRRSARMAYRRGLVRFSGLRLMRALSHFDHTAGERIVSEVEPGITMRLDMSSYLDRCVYYQGNYRPWVIDQFVQYIQEGDTVIDVGANIGSYSLRFAQKVGKTGRVFAFEPEPSVFQRLQDNLALNQTSNLEALAMAVADDAGELEFFVTPEDSENHGRSALFPSDWRARAVVVPTTSIDRFMEDRNLRQLRAIKADTQGAEHKVLVGAARTIRELAPLIFLRLNQSNSRVAGCDTAQSVELLRDHGYDLYVMDGKKMRRYADADCADDCTLIARKEAPAG